MTASSPQQVSKTPDFNRQPTDTAPSPLGRILVAPEASEHANKALEEAIRLTKSADGVITGIHAYAAMQDRRFKMMEGGLPERYLEEQEMGYQREVHDDLITRGLKAISLELAEEGVAEPRRTMCPAPIREDKAEAAAAPAVPDAEARLARVPKGFMREMTRQRIEAFAHESGADGVTLDFVENKYASWAEGSVKRQSAMVWKGSSARIERIPDFIRPMVVLEIERCAREMGLDVVSGAAIDRASEACNGMGAFHSEGAPGQYKTRSAKVLKG